MQKNISSVNSRQISKAIVQPKPTINTPGDEYEQEADAMADKVMRMPLNKSETNHFTGIIGNSIQRKCATCEEDEEKKKTIMRKAVNGNHDFTASSSFASSLNTSRGNGMPLSPKTKNFMENAFSTDFSKVRIHAGNEASELNKEINAKAFTYGKDIYFNQGEYNPEIPEGKHLLAHELSHVVQQGYASSEEKSDLSLLKLSAGPTRIARKQSPSNSGNVMVGYVAIYLNDKTNYIDFHTERGLFRYNLEPPSGLQPGEYEVNVEVVEGDVNFRFNVRDGKLFHFNYNIDAGKPNPATFFAHQKSVTFTITTDTPPSIQKNKEAGAEDPDATYLSIEEAMERCESGDLPGVKIFPFRGTRFGGAPLTVMRDGDDIIVKSYMHVLADKDFKAQTRTLPLETFLGGVRLKPNEIVRVHTYEPRWYHLNITGSTSGNIEDEFCVTGEGMIEIGKRSDRAFIGNVVLTVIDAATFFIPVGRIAAMIGKPIAQVAARGARNAAIGIMLGLREAAPGAFAGIASRTSTVLIEEQVVDQAAGRAITQTASHATIQFSEQALAQTVTRAATGTAVDVGTNKVGEAIARR